LAAAIPALTATCRNLACNDLESLAGQLNTAVALVSVTVPTREGEGVGDGVGMLVGVLVGTFVGVAVGTFVAQDCVSLDVDPVHAVPDSNDGDVHA